MDVKQLQYFISIARNRNFTQSAKENFITQSTISYAISELERELNVKLFVRNSHEVILTEAGEVYYKYAMSVLDTLLTGESELRNIAMGKTGIIRISMVPTLDKALVGVLSLFHSRYPNIQVELACTTGVHQIYSINRRAHDIYFSFRTLLENHEGLNYLVAEKDRYQLYLPESLSDKVDPRDFSTLAGLSLIIEKRTEGPFLVNTVLEMCAARGLDVTPSLLAFNDTEAVLTGVNAGLGYTILPRAMSHLMDPARVVALPIPGDDVTVDYAVGWDRSSSNNAVEFFLDTLRELYPNAPVLST